MQNNHSKACSQDLPRTFAVSKEQVKAIFYTIFFIGAMSFLLIIWGIFLSTAAEILFFFVAIFLFQWWNFRRYTLAVDDDGIWHVKKGKAKTFIAWQNIVSYRRNWWSGQLELLDENEQARVKITPILAHLNELHALLLAKSNLLTTIDTSQKQFIKAYHRLFYFFMSLLTLIIAVAVYIIPRGNSCCTVATENCATTRPMIVAILIAAILLAMILFSYSTTIYRLIIKDNHLQLYYPFRRKIIAFTDIKNIEITGFRNLTMTTHTHKKPFYLTALGNDPLTLYHCLTKATALYPYPNNSVASAPTAQNRGNNNNNVSHDE